MGALATVLAIVGSSASAPVSTLGLNRGMLVANPQGQEFELVPVNNMERSGPELMSMNPQMQMLTCFGHCGAECMQYCKENYEKCTHNDPASRMYQYGDHLEPAPDFSAPTGRGLGGPDHPNHCATTLERCELPTLETENWGVD